MVPPVRVRRRDEDTGLNTSSPRLGETGREANHGCEESTPDTPCVCGWIDSERRGAERVANQRMFIAIVINPATNTIAIGVTLDGADRTSQSRIARTSA